MKFEDVSRSLRSEIEGWADEEILEKSSQNHSRPPKSPPHASTSSGPVSLVTSPSPDPVDARRQP